YMQGRVVPLLEPDGAVREWVGVCIDDDERRRSDEERRRREREFATLAEGAPDVIGRLDRSHRLRYVNPAVSSLVDVEPAQCIGKNVLELGAEEAAARVWKQELDAVFETGKPRTFELETHRPTGEKVFVHARVVPEPSTDGQVHGVIAVLRDLTELKRNEEALRESESFLKLAQQSAGMGVWDFDLVTGASRWSVETYRLYGRDPSLPSPTPHERLSLIHPDDRLQLEQALAPVLAGVEESWRVQFRVMHPERGERWLLEVGQRRGQKGAGITLDVTDQTLAEARLRQSAKMEAVGRLAGGLAHDFNNQLQVIRGFANVVARDRGLAPRSREQLAEIGNAVDRMGSLTVQLLAFSRQQVLRPESVDLDAAIAEDEPMLARLIGSQVRLRLELGEGSKWVRVDRGQLLQVLMNLTINARDAMPSGGEIIIRTRLRHVVNGELDTLVDSPVPSGRYVELSVRDTGEGIAPGLLTHIFEPFFTTKEVGRGTGLGLATVHGIVTQSRGHVWVQSAPDQ
ncbi:MAG: PAS domain-containing protein, partial [Polyangiaceae bacterium]|nr:PAS domain-containing protein [Polyangiaceae bacterium]